MKKISICIPSYNEENNIQQIYKKILFEFNYNLKNYDYEIVFVNDGSTDSTLQQMLKLAKTDNKVKIIDLSRNFGKEIAMIAGLDNVKGDMVVIMDSDLQHPPHVIPKMVKLWEKGYQDIYGKRVKREKEPFVKKQLSRLYYKILSILSGYKIEDGIGDFRLLDRECIDAIIKLRDKQRYTKGMYEWIGFEKTSIDYIAEERFSGETKWSMGGLFRLAIDGITSQSIRPLKLPFYIGAFLIVISVSILIIHFFSNNFSLSQLSIIIFAIIFMTGVQLLFLGIMGEYLGKVSIESKERPIYFINIKNSKL